MITNYTLWRGGKFAASVKPNLIYEGSIPIRKSSSKRQIWQMHLALLFVLFFTQSIIAQTNYYSKATATDFNDVNSWGTATDGTGASPASISNADNFFVANASVLSLSGNASVRQLTISSGSLTVSANTLTVSKAGAFDTTLALSGGTLNLSAGSIILNGNFNLTAGGKFNQSGGTISVDGNNGGVATGSVATGTFIVNFAPTANTDVNLSGGTFTIVDPHYTTTNTFQVSAPTVGSLPATGTHTFKFGDGISTDNGGANGFAFYSWNGSGIFKFRNVIIETVTGGNNRFLLMNGTFNNFAATGTVIINSGAEFRNSGTSTTGGANYFTGDLINNGTFTSSAGVHFSDVTSSTASALAVSLSTNAQTVSGTGIFRNLTSAPTANLTSVTINNSNALGITFVGTNNIATQPANSFSLSGTLTFTNGKVFTSGGSSFVLGSSASSLGTLSYVSGGFASGVTFGRWFGATTTGSTITASADATTVTSRYPFIGLNNANRSAWIERATPAAAGGVLAVTYTNVDGYTTTSLTDGATTLDTKANDSWSVSSLSGTPTAAASFKLNIVAPTIFGGPLNASSVRIVKSDNTFVGAHQAGTTTPGGQRITILPADLISGSFTLATNAADVPFVSVATGNWNSATTWNKGTVPTCNDAVSIAASTTVTINSTGNVAKNITINSGGTLLQASGDLTVDACTSINNNFINNSGALTVTGGTLTVNGNLNNATGSAFNQSGGNINVDGNNGAVTANSVASGTHIVLIATDNVSLTGGTLTVVDPHAASSTSSYAFSYTGTAAINNTVGWTLKFGNGTSTDAGGTTGTASAAGGFIWNNAGGKIYYDNVVIDSGAGTNRNVYNSSTTIGINNLTINPAGELVMATSGISIGGNFVNNGTFTHTAATLAFQNFQSATATASVNPQAISGTGVFRNNLVTASSTASLNSILFNNTNATGITLNVPLSVGGTLTMTSGLINTTNTNLLRLGTAAAAGVFSGTPSATNMVKGPFARTIVSGNANTNYILFPVGKSAYTPIWLAPTTTAVSVMKAEAFDSNTGTFDASLINMSSGRRWEAPLVSGTITNLNVRLGDATIVNTNIPVQAPTASGVYTNAFGSVATFVAGTPNTIQSGTVILPANYTGFLSYADSNTCSGTPTPGNTVASSVAICSGESVTLSLQNPTSGSGVTYVWESSADGVAYAPISGATNPTYVATPTASTYYRAQVTCSGNTGTSTAVQVNFSNNITGTTPGTRCGTGTVQLAAAANTGATIKWYDAATAGNLVGTGSPFTTPSIASTQSFWAVAETSGPVLAGGIIAPPSDWTGSTLTDWGIIFNALNAVTINSVDLYSTVAGTVNLKIVNSTGTELYSTGNVSIANGGTTTPNVVPINFSVPAGTNYKILVKSYTGVSLVRGSTSLAFPYTNGNISITASEWGGSTTSTYYYMYNIKTTTACSSTRVPVVATVNTAPTLTLSSNPAPVCQGTQTTAVTLTAGASDYDTYVWSPSTGVSGDAVTGWTFNPTATTAYTVTATNSVTGCINAATVNVTISATPSAITVVPDSPTICAGSIQQLTTTGGIVAPSIVSGTGATTSGTSATNAALGPNPLQAYYGGTKQQWIYTVAELTSLGFVANTRINAIKLDLATANTTYALNNLVVKMKNSPTASFATTTSWETGLTTVRAASSYTPVVGANTFTLDAPFTWNGTDNLVIEMNYSNNNGGNTTAYNTAKHSPTSFVSTIYYRADNQTATAVNTFVGTASYTYSSRSDVAFDVIAPTTWSSTGTGDLFTDAAATIPYVSGNAVAIVYAKPSATATYTATATLGTCTSTDSSTITVTPNTVPDFAEIGSICQGSVAPTLATTSPNGVVGTWTPATVSNTANGSYVFTPNAGQCAVTQTLNVTVNTTAAPTGDATQYGTTLADLVVSPTTGITWYGSEADALASTNELPLTTALVDGATYYATQTTTCESLPFAVTIDFDLKTPSFNMNSLKYYPNPVSNVLTVTYSEAITGLKLYNMVGQQLMSKSVNSNETQLDMSHLPAGSYLLEITAGTKSKMVKLLKNQ